jgi:hypothetical protein
MKAISNSGAANLVFEQLYSNGTAIHGCTKNELGGSIFRGFGLESFYFNHGVYVS